MLNITEQQIKIVLDALKECFFDNLTSETYYGDVMERCDHSVFGIDSHDIGATKLVLMPREFEFVVKIPFFGEDWDETNEEYIQFSGADEPEGWNYCEVESILYSKAEAEEVDKYFLETRCIGFVKGYPIYAQELASTLYEIKEDSSFNNSEKTEIKKGKAKVRSFCRRRNTHCFNVTWVKDFIDFYGEEAWCKLDQFIYNYKVCDLHTSNIGYNTMGAPVIMDYAGYSS